MRRLLPSTAPAALALMLAAATGPALAQPQGVPLMKPPISATPAATPPAAKTAQGQPFRTITWEALVPKDWDPFAEFKGIDLASMQDGDPRTNELMKRMREVWDRAPVNTALVGQQVRIPGFVVPL